ncbi:hypothetical protein EMIHUDRAFT_239784 [Emiliania huxleyi CCMP1516]|uniref:Uncharacterized protein n=2 Tax=Emiliania huxleyi TaxID=2903 RepID=A0A0D3JII9_EMIH1|nr:hypothetical protein EMIHUDRAFT_239784 [Emiliania huxleyi CCMP1516]EOD23324.1 hypothetical protein EMIHUDRAFT_239784 [Emiliania huxleyi CCMP1516]|eukprot:XP_005775753.1 hypothetical protein EMIHUDRAFT_239784 [Emiliania huxleyi CCMP1516]
MPRFSASESFAFSEWRPTEAAADKLEAAADKASAAPPCGGVVPPELLQMGEAVAEALGLYARLAAERHVGVCSHVLSQASALLSERPEPAPTSPASLLDALVAEHERELRDKDAYHTRYEECAEEQRRALVSRVLAVEEKQAASDATAAALQQANESIAQLHFAESLGELQACMARSSLGTGGGSSAVAVAMASADAGAKEARGFNGASDSDATRLSASSDEECRAADDCATDKPGAGCPVPVPVGAPAAEREGAAQEETTRAVAPPAQLREIRATSSLQRQPQPQAPPALPPPQVVTPALPPMPPARPLQPAATASVAGQAPPAPAAPHAAASASSATAAPSAAAASRLPGQLAIAGGVATRRAPSSAYATPHAASSHTASRLLAAGGDGAKTRLPEAASAFEFTNGPQPSALHEPVASSAVSAPAPPPLELAVALFGLDDALATLINPPARMAMAGALPAAATPSPGQQARVPQNKKKRRRAGHAVSARSALGPVRKLDLFAEDD